MYFVFVCVFVCMYTLDVHMCIPYVYVCVFLDVFVLCDCVYFFCVCVLCVYFVCVCELCVYFLYVSVCMYVCIYVCMYLCVCVCERERETGILITLCICV